MSKKPAPKRKKADKPAAKPRPRSKKPVKAGASPVKPKAAVAPQAATPNAPSTVKVSAAKGRPMLTWVGKRPLGQVNAFPAQMVERHDALRILGMPNGDPDKYKERIKILGDLRASCNERCWKEAPYPGGARAPEIGGLLYYGDNGEVLASLISSGFRASAKLVYIDPPFDSAADYVRKVSLRGGARGAKLAGDSYSVGEQMQYSDIWANDNYLQFMYERLMLLKEVLHDQGTIALHCDARRSHSLRYLLEEVFGSDNFRAEVVVRAGVKNVQSQFDEVAGLTLGSNSILVYSKSTDTKYPLLKTDFEQIEGGKWDTFWRGTERETMRYPLFGQTPAHGQWRWEPDRTTAAIANYEEYRAKHMRDTSLDDYYLERRAAGVDLDFVRLSEDGVAQYYVSPRADRMVSTIWFDLPYRGTATDYPTEKNEAIPSRLIKWTTQPGDLVLDCFIGSGTTAAIAQRLGRRWIACDINKGAIQTTTKRLRTIIDGQIRDALKAREDERQGKLPGMEGERPPKPCQFGFNAFRVNDYDLAIQHNEAVNLACETIGVQRSRADGFFDGTLGKALVKVIPFGHPLSPIDLEEIKRELDARPDEDRPIRVVSLGMELAAQAWVGEWNRVRKGGDAANRIDVIDLRTDPVHGGFIKHEPATARIKAARRGHNLVVEIQEFISPTIIQRLQQQAGVVNPKIDDWRAMVDCVMIDPAFNGSVLQVALADVPPRKQDLVKGVYELPAPADETTVAIKIVDMLGEEVLVIQPV